MPLYRWDSKAVRDPCPTVTQLVSDRAEICTQLAWPPNLPFQLLGDDASLSCTEKWVGVWRGISSRWLIPGEWNCWEFLFSTLAYL